VELCLGEKTHQISGVTIVCLKEYFDKKPDVALNHPRMPALLVNVFICHAHAHLVLYEALV